ncbi:MAG: hypothetical protein ACRENE_12490 [Polyangiaceae bacterium]
MAGPSRKLKQPPQVVLDPSDARHAKALAQLANDRLSNVDGEDYLKWLETGEGKNPRRGSSD